MRITALAVLAAAVSVAAVPFDPDDWDILPLAASVHLLAVSPEGFATNIAEMPKGMLRSAGYDRKIRAKGMTLKREEALAKEAESYESDRRLLLENVASLQDAVERAAAAGSLNLESAGWALTAKGQAALGTRKPRKSDFARRKADPDDGPPKDQVRLQPGELEFKP